MYLFNLLISISLILNIFLSSELIFLKTAVLDLQSNERPFLAYENVSIYNRLSVLSPISRYLSRESAREYAYTYTHIYMYILYVYAFGFINIIYF